MDANGQYKEVPDITRTEAGETDTTATVPSSHTLKDGFSYDGANHLTAVQ